MGLCIALCCEEEVVHYGTVHCVVLCLEGAVQLKDFCMNNKWKWGNFALGQGGDLHEPAG